MVNPHGQTISSVPRAFTVLKALNPQFLAALVTSTLREGSGSQQTVSSAQLGISAVVSADVFESWDLHSVKWGEVGTSTALFCTAHITFTKHKHPVLFHLYFCGVFHSNQNTTCYSMSSLFLGSDTFCRCILKEFSLSGKQNSLADRYLVQLSARVSALRQLLRGSHNLFAQYMYLLPPTTLKYLRSHWW